MKRAITAILLAVFLLPAFVACGGPKTTVTLVITMPDGSQNIREITTRETYLGEALRSKGIIQCDELGGIISVEGVEANWDKDQTFWAFEIDGAYAGQGVDDEEITAGKVYALIFTQG